MSVFVCDVDFWLASRIHDIFSGSFIMFVHFYLILLCVNYAFFCFARFAIIFYVARRTKSKVACLK